MSLPIGKCTWRGSNQGPLGPESSALPLYHADSIKVHLYHRISLKNLVMVYDALQSCQRKHADVVGNTARKVLILPGGSPDVRNALPSGSAGHCPCGWTIWNNNNPYLTKLRSARIVRNATEGAIAGRLGSVSESGVVLRKFVQWYQPRPTRSFSPHLCLASCIGNYMRKDVGTHFVFWIIWLAAMLDHSHTHILVLCSSSMGNNIHILFYMSCKVN